MKLPTSERELFLAYCRALEGVPYDYGGRDASGLDCSGLVAYALKLATGGRVDLRRWWCAILWERLEDVSTADAQPGDLAFYGKPEHSTHVMVLLDDGRVLGAAGGTPETKKSNARADQCVQHRSGIRYRKDFLGLKRLPLGPSVKTPTA